MKRLLAGLAVAVVYFSESAVVPAVSRPGQPEASVPSHFTAVPDWPKRVPGRAQMGQMHGDVAVSSNGDTYVSTEDPEASLQVYAPDGTFLRNVPAAPSDFHGFVIRRQPDGEFIYGTRLLGQEIVKMTLDGKVEMTIPASVIPQKFKYRAATGPLGLELQQFVDGVFKFYGIPGDDPRRRNNEVLLTGMDVAPNGDLYVTDGYASDYVHRFDRSGKYLASFGGRGEPYNFSTFHKLVVDTRFQPPRILGCDRVHNRLVHLALDGSMIGVVANDLLLPAAIALSGDNVVVGEFKGRVTILDKAGRVVEHLGTNTEPGVASNALPPEKWRTGYVVAPHGVAVNANGDVFVAEFTKFGRVHKFSRH